MSELISDNESSFEFLNDSERSDGPDGEPELESSAEAEEEVVKEVEAPGDKNAADDGKLALDNFEAPTATDVNAVWKPVSPTSAAQKSAQQETTKPAWLAGELAANTRAFSDRNNQKRETYSNMVMTAPQPYVFVPVAPPGAPSPQCGAHELNLRISCRDRKISVVEQSVVAPAMAPAIAPAKAPAKAPVTPSAETTRTPWKTSRSNAIPTFFNFMFHCAIILAFIALLVSYNELKVSKTNLASNIEHDLSKAQLEITKLTDELEKVKRDLQSVIDRAMKDRKDNFKKIKCLEDIPEELMDKWIPDEEKFQLMDWFNKEYIQLLRKAHLNLTRVSENQMTIYLAWESKVLWDDTLQGSCAYSTKDGCFKFFLKEGLVYITFECNSESEAEKFTLVYSMPDEYL